MSGLTKEQALAVLAAGEPNGRPPTGSEESSPLVISSAASFIAVERPPLRRWLATGDGHSVLLAPETGLLVASPSGLGKSLAVDDLAGHLASDEGGEWLGLDAVGGLRVLVLALEGADEENAHRLEQLVPPSARERLFMLDRWRGATARADEPGIENLARAIAEHEIDVLVLDTAPAYFSGVVDTSRGLPEEAHDRIEELRERSGRRFAWVATAHTRKADRTGAVVDELEEVAGTIAKKADAAIVLRRDGDDGPRRRVLFAKTRRGPQPEPLLATLPTDPTDPPRLTVITSLKAEETAEQRRQAIVDYVTANPGCGREEAVREAGGRAQTTREIVRELVASGWLDAGKGGKGLYPASQLGMEPRPEHRTQADVPDATLGDDPRPERPPRPVGTGTSGRGADGGPDEEAHA